MAKKNNTIRSVVRYLVLVIFLCLLLFYFQIEKTIFSSIQTLKRFQIADIAMQTQNHPIILSELNKAKIDLADTQKNVMYCGLIQYVPFANIYYKDITYMLSSRSIWIDATTKIYQLKTQNNMNDKKTNIQSTLIALSQAKTQLKTIKSQNYHIFFMEEKIKKIKNKYIALIEETVKSLESTN